MNPLASHWLRVSVLLLVMMPLVALAVAWESGVDFAPAAIITLYVWVVVCVILALVALAGVIVRLLGRGYRAIRR